MARIALKALLTTALLLLFWGLAVPQTPTYTTVYVYDELGRLKAVIVPSGETAIYTYDAAGNIVSIARQMSTEVSIIEFTPNEGAESASVTIYGTGFSITPSENTVSFNGVAATVTAASATQIITSVPVGAATGPITITTPTGMATSSSPFVVQHFLSITSFTPTIGTAGTAVRINGTEFDPTPSNDQVKFNITNATVSAATSTTIDTNVPTGATSGRISLTTPIGSAVSNGDFFVPPSPYTAASVDFTARMALGETRTIIVSAANRVALVVFDGAVGQRISLQAANTTISSTTVRIIKPDGSNLLNPTSLSGNWFVDTLTLPVTGTYTILVDPNSTFTGSLNLTLHNVPPDATATVTAGGPAVTITTTTPGQNANVTFGGTAGQRVSLNINNVTISSTSVTVLKPDGTTLISASNVTSGGWFFDTMTLPATGTYSVVINPKIAATGSVTLTLYDVPPDATGTIVIGGPQVIITIDTPGQNGQLTFSGTAGQIVQLEFWGSLNMSWPILTKPDGSSLDDGDYGNDGDDVYQLPVTGTYTIPINPNGSSIGSTTFVLYEIPQPITGTIEADGPPLTVTFPTANQIGKISFSGTAGQRVSLKISDVKMGQDYGWVEMVDPAGNYLGDDYAYSDDSYLDSGWLDTQRLIDTIQLPATGTYTINVLPGYDSSGSLTLTLYNVPTNVTATITPGGPPLTVTTTVPGQDARVSFSGTAGQRLSLKVTDSIYPYSEVYVLKPDSSVLSGFGFPTYPNGEGGFEDTFTLPVSGTYTIVVDGYFGWAGTTTMALHDVPAILTGTITFGGPPVTVTAAAPGQDAEVTFSGTAGQRMSLKVSGTLPVGSDIFIFKPNGQALTSSKFIRQIGAARAELFETTLLPNTGTYKVKVDTWDAAGTITFELSEVPSDVEDAQITIGGPPVTVTSTAPRQNRLLTFEGTAGQLVHLKINNDNSWLNHVWIYKPDGFVLNRRLADAAGAKLIEGTTLPMSGTYTILTEFWGNGDSVTLTLGTGTGDIGGTIAVNGPPLTIDVPTSRQKANYAFNGTAGQRVGMKVTDVTMPRGFVSLNGDPDDNYNFVGTESTVHERFIFYNLLNTGPNAVVVRPNFDHIGGATVRLYDVPPDISGTITANGPPVNLTMSIGQNATLTFDGTTGQQVTLRVINNTISKIYIEVFKPTGLQQSFFIGSGANFDLPVQTLPTPGTYSIYIDPWKGNAGTVTVSVTSP